MIKKNIKFSNFISKKNLSINKRILNYFNNLMRDRSEIFLSLDKSYKDSFSNDFVKKFNNKSVISLIGMGGSILGAKAIYSFLSPKNTKFEFIDNLLKIPKPKNKKKRLNLIISKSGNTLETISNSNIFINKKDKNIFITENKKNYLFQLAHKLGSDVIYHNDLIGGRYSVLSEVGMLPAKLMGLNPKKFRRLNILIKNRHFIDSLIRNVSSIYHLMKQKKTNSVILNYDEKSNELFLWYQQLVAESLGKKSQGILPILSTMPKDNHSLMQHYLDGVKNNFFTFFFVKDKNSAKLKKNTILKSHSYLKNKSLDEISYSQFLATMKVFKKKRIPFRTFVINNRDEETLGELFIFFILETILLGKLMKIDPFNQPAVELIKKQTKKILISE